MTRTSAQTPIRTFVSVGRSAYGALLGCRVALCGASSDAVGACWHCQVFTEVGLVESSSRYIDLRHVIAGPLVQGIDGPAEGFAEWGDLIPDRHRAGLEDLAVDESVAFEAPERAGQHLLSDPRDRSAQLVEPMWSLAQMGEHLERPLVEDLAEQLALVLVQLNIVGARSRTRGFRHDT